MHYIPWVKRKITLNVGCLQRVIHYFSRPRSMQLTERHSFYPTFPVTTANILLCETNCGFLRGCIHFVHLSSRSYSHWHYVCCIWAFIALLEPHLSSIGSVRTWRNFRGSTHAGTVKRSTQKIHRLNKRSRFFRSTPVLFVPLSCNLHSIHYTSAT